MMAASGEAAFFYLALLRTSPLFINHALHLASIFGFLDYFLYSLKKPNRSTIAERQLSFASGNPIHLCSLKKNIASHFELKKAHSKR